MVEEGRRGMRRTCEAEQSVLYLHWRELLASWGVGCTYPVLPIKWVISVELTKTKSGELE
jgi:hypothetical protein